MKKICVFTQIGATAFANESREENDFYATPPLAVQELLDRESFRKTILEPCVGMGHIAYVLKDNGYNVVAQDIIDRGFPNTTIKDFMCMKHNNLDIVTNPPYKMAGQFIEHAMNISEEGTKIAMFLKLTFLESVSRKTMFEKYPMKTLWVCSQRRSCAKDGDFKKYNSGAVANGWYIWEKGFNGNPIIKWI